MKEVMYLFCKAICMVINFAKYLVICWGLFEPEKLYINQIFPFRSYSFEDILNYLGLYLKENIYLKKDWTWLLSKIEKK
jgi:hypothetical protein